MPEEGRLFSTVDRNYKDVMRHLDKDQHVRINISAIISITYPSFPKGNGCDWPFWSIR